MIDIGDVFVPFFVKVLTKISDQSPDVFAESEEDSDEELKMKKKVERYDPGTTKLDSSGLYYKDTDSELEMESASESEDEKEGLGLQIFNLHSFNLVIMFYKLFFNKNHFRRFQ